MIGTSIHTVPCGQSHSRMLAIIFAAYAFVLPFIPARADDHVIDFEKAEVGKPVASWVDQGVRIEPARPLEKSKAIARITFFPHLGTGRIGVVNAMANEAIPVRATFERGARKVTARLWGSTTSAAYMEAFDKAGNSLAKKALEKVPVRQTPEEHVPFFDLSIEASAIAYVEIGGAKPGGFMAVDELRWTADDESN